MIMLLFEGTMYINQSATVTNGEFDRHFLSQKSVDDPRIRFTHSTTSVASSHIVCGLLAFTWNPGGGVVCLGLHPSRLVWLEMRSLPPFAP